MQNLGSLLIKSISVSFGDTHKCGWWCCSCRTYYKDKPEICDHMIRSEIDFNKLLPIYNEYLKKSNESELTLEQLINEYKRAEDYIYSTCGYVERYYEDILSIADNNPDVWTNEYCNSKEFVYDTRDCSMVIDKYDSYYNNLCNELIKHKA
jgi:N-glycosylase/DNA lyase